VRLQTRPDGVIFVPIGSLTTAGDTLNRPDHPETPSSGPAAQPARAAVASTPGAFSLRLPSRPDLLALLALIAIVVLAWCTANDAWTPASWQRTSAYIEDQEKSDVVWMLALVKAASEGSGLPLAWKRVPALGAPSNANWTDWPLIEELQPAILGIFSRAVGPFAALNIGMLLGHLLAAVTFYAVARHSDCLARWAFVGALAYGLAPFVFAQSPHHLTVQWAWHVPLFLLVWRWVSTDPGIAPRSPRFRTATAIGFVAGLQNVYYTNILCQLTLLGAAIQYVRNRAKPALLSALTVIGVAAFAFVLMSLDTWTYKLIHGANTQALVREYKWLEIYGLKIVDLFIPPLNHHSGLLSAFAIAHRQAAPLLDELASYQGIVGLACLLWLVGTAVAAMVRRQERDVPMEAWQILWIVLMFTTGGLNAIIGSLGFTMFRGACRYSIVILAITLLYAARRLSAIERAAATKPGEGRPMLWTATAAGLCLLVLWDQVPPALKADKTALISRQIEADRQFTARMEAALPAGAMVFQLPIMEFPEAPAPGVPPYDHLRPYLYGNRLRYSFGDVKGRADGNWQAQLGRLPSLEKVVEEIKARGFAAIYINRNGFPDRAKAIEEKLLEMGYSKPPIRNASGELSCILLEKD
jgi:hypothetical protein